MLDAPKSLVKCSFVQGSVLFAIFCIESEPIFLQVTKISGDYLVYRGVLLEHDVEFTTL